MRSRKTILAVMCSTPLALAACGNDGADSGSTNSPSSEEAHVDDRGDDPHLEDHGHPDAPEAVLEDDPGGQLCTDQSGAPGHYVPVEGGFICEATEDAPQ